jgi:hypothetical protein
LEVAALEEEAAEAVAEAAVEEAAAEVEVAEAVVEVEVNVIKVMGAPSSARCQISVKCRTGLL